MRDFDYTPLDAVTLGQLSTNAMKRDAGSAVHMARVGQYDAKTRNAVDKRLLEACKLTEDGFAMTNAGLQFLAEFERLGGFGDKQTTFQQELFFFKLFTKIIQGILDKALAEQETKRQERYDAFLAAITPKPVTIQGDPRCMNHQAGVACPVHGPAPASEVVEDDDELDDDEDDTDLHEAEPEKPDPAQHPDTITVERFGHQSYRATFNGFNRSLGQPMEVKGSEASSRNYAVAQLFDALDKHNIQTDANVKFVYLGANRPYAGR